MSKTTAQPKRAPGGTCGADGSPAPAPGQVWDGIHGARFIICTVGEDGTVGGYHVNDAPTNFFPAEYFKTHYTIDQYYRRKANAPHHPSGCSGAEPR